MVSSISKVSQPGKKIFRVLMTAPVILAVILLMFTEHAFAQIRADQKAEWPGTIDSRKQILESHLRGIRIVPGAWRPHFSWEQIAWVKPPWNTHDYIWLDFPEAIWSDRGLLFLSHINPRLNQVSPDEPRIPWREIPDGIAYERILSDNITVGGSLTNEGESTVALTLYIRNGSDTSLTGVRMQTCAFLRHSKEFSKFTRDNKFVHLPERGWVKFDDAVAATVENGKYRLKWDGGNTADRPVLITLARSEEQSESQRLVAMTWDSATYMLFSNPRHPCMHADPIFPVIAPGATATVRGRLIFFEGTPDGLWEEHFKN